MSYLETIYFKNEYAETDYPQQLCNHIAERYMAGVGKDKGALLDIGSGKGNHLLGFHRAGYKVTGLDKRNECVEALREQKADIEVRECDIENEPFPFESDTFDWVYSKSVLEHVRNVDNFISESLRVLKPGGKAVLLTPAWESQYKFFWDDYTHVTAFTRKSLQNAMKIHGYKNVRCDFFLQLPVVWKYPAMRILTELTAFVVPDALKWKDHEQSQPRTWIRFSKEKMLLSVGEKEK